MKKLLVLVVVLLAGVAVFLFLRSERTYTNFPPQTGKVWVAFGDSLTSGHGAGEGSDYPSVLSKALGIPIVTVAAPGRTSEGGLARIDEVVQLNPRVVLLCFGGNDTLNRVPPERTFQNLSDMIDALHQAGAFVVLIGIRSASAWDKYHAQFKTLAKRKKVLFVPNILGGVLGNPSLMSDYVHPNEQGYTVIAERLETILRPLLPDLAPP